MTALLTNILSDLAMDALTDERTINSAYIYAGQFSGWSASKLEYAARSLRRQEQAFYALANRPPEMIKIPPRVSRRRELVQIIHECWKE